MCTYIFIADIATPPISSRLENSSRRSWWNERIEEAKSSSRSSFFSNRWYREKNIPQPRKQKDRMFGLALDRLSPPLPSSWKNISEKSVDRVSTSISISRFRRKLEILLEANILLSIEEKKRMFLGSKFVDEGVSSNFEINCANWYHRMTIYKRRNRIEK